MANEKCLEILPEKVNSTWVKASDLLYTEYIKFLKITPPGDRSDLIIKFLLTRYSDKSNPKKLLKPENLSKWLAQLSEALAEEKKPLTPRQERLLKTNIKRIIKNMHQNVDFSIRRPKFMTLKKLEALTVALWKNHRGKRRPDLYLAASVILVMAWLGGSRVIDIIRLQWSDLKLIKNKSGEYLKCKVRFSKSNPNRPEALTFKKTPNKIFDVIDRLQKWSKKSNNRKGFIFPDNGVNSHIKTHQVVNCWRIAARDIGWPEPDWPRGHSGRNSCVPLLMKLGQKSQRINVFLRWQHGSSMLSHYQGSSLECSTEGSAYMLEKALREGTLEKVTDIQ